MIQNANASVIKKKESHMSKRITIMIDDVLNKKIRWLQAKMIQKENKLISYSFVVNSLLKNSLK
jgi:hypothetical protein